MAWDMGKNRRRRAGPLRVGSPYRRNILFTQSDPRKPHAASSVTTPTINPPR